MTVNVGQVVSISNVQIQYKVIKYTMYIKIVTHALIFFCGLKKVLITAMVLGILGNFLNLKRR